MSELGRASGQERSGHGRAGGHRFPLV